MFDCPRVIYVALPFYVKRTTSHNERMAMPSDQAEQSDKMGFRSNGLDKARAVTEDPGCSGTSQKLEPLDIATDAEAGRPHRTKGRIALTITALGVC